MTTVMRQLPSTEEATAAVPASYDNGTVDYPSSTQEIYRFYEGSILIRTITVNYTDASKANISNWAIL